MNTDKHHTSGLANIRSVKLQVCLHFRSGILSIKKHVRLSCCNLVRWYWLHLVIITVKPHISGLVETEGYIVAPVNLAAEMGNDTDERKLFCLIF